MPTTTTASATRSPGGAFVERRLAVPLRRRLPLRRLRRTQACRGRLSRGFPRIGLALLVLGVARGELGTVDPAGFSLESIAAWLYLAVFGSLIGFTAYAWLLRNAPISKVVTHQYVNPLVAIILGAALLDEQLTAATGLGSALIVGSVFVAVR